MVNLSNFTPFSFADLLLSSSSFFSNSLLTLLLLILALLQITVCISPLRLFLLPISLLLLKASSHRVFTVLLTSSVICLYSETCFSISRLLLCTSLGWSPFSIISALEFLPSVREHYQSVAPRLFVITLLPSTRSFRGFWVHHL